MIGTIRTFDKDIQKDFHDRIRHVLVPPVEMGAEDFPFLTQNSKGLYFYLGVRTKGKEITPQHSPNYYVDESALIIGTKTLANLAIDYLKMK